jgi:hypothetical protein
MLHACKPRRTTYAYSLAAIAATSLIAATHAQNANRGPLEPAWTWNAPATIEWCEPVGVPPIAVLIHTQDGRLEQLHLITGKPCFRKAPGSVKGQRFAGSSAETAYVYDNEIVRAIGVTRAAPTEKPDAPELWSIDGASGAEKPRDDDPEFKRRLLAARVTLAGILVARSDGRIAELNRANGGLRWSTALPPVAEMRLFTTDGLAIVLHKGKSGIDASLFDLTAAAPTPHTIDFSESWPMWCEPGADGLIAAWPSKITRLTSDGKIEPARPRFQPPIRADGIALLPKLQEHSRPLLTLLEQSGELSAHDMLTSERVWSAKLGNSGGGALEAVGEYVLIIGQHGELEAHHRDAGTLVARYTGPAGTRSLGAALAANFLFSLRTIRTAVGEEWQIVRTPLLRPGDWTRQRAAATEATWSLGRSGKTRTVLWPPGRVIIVEERRIQTYVLPNE